MADQSDKKKALKPLRPPREVEAAYRRQLLVIASAIASQVKSEILPLFAAAGVIDPDSFLDIYSPVIDRLRDQFTLDQAAASVSAEFNGNMYRFSKKRFDNMLKRYYGADIDILEIIKEEGIESTLKASVRENVRLIKSIPSRYFDQIDKMVIDSFTGRIDLKGESITEFLRKRINEENVKLKMGASARAKLIARDQSAKIQTTFTRIRAQNLGSEGYFWMNSQDKAVRGAPGNIYGQTPDKTPSGRDHWKRQGKFFLWTRPPQDGHPGIPVNCRCLPRAVLPRLKDLGYDYASVQKNLIESQRRLQSSWGL